MSCLVWIIIANPKEEEKQSSVLEDFRFDWWREFEKMRTTTIEYYLVFLELRCFSSMLPSMPKGEIVSMNVDDISMGEYCRAMTCCIHNYVCHWCQHRNKIVKTNRIGDCDLCIKDNRLIIYWCIVVDMYYNMSWSWGSMHKT